MSNLAKIICYSIAKVANYIVWLAFPNSAGGEFFLTPELHFPISDANH